MIRFPLPTRLGFTLLIALALAPADPGYAAGPTVVPPGPGQLSALLENTPNIPRNLYALTERLKLHTTTPINPIVNAVPTNYPVGREDQFYVSSGKGNVLITARLLYKTAHAYFYVQDGTKVDMKKLSASAQLFEQKTYPEDHAAFGTEWLPGIDNDAHTTVLNVLLQGAGEGGYVYAEDQFPRSVYPYSNQRKIAYINLGATALGTPSYDATVAHEFQHVIHAHMHPMDEAWINEGDSVLAQLLNGYSADSWDAAKAQKPDSQLDSADPSTGTDIYANGYLWMLYFYEHFGGNRATRLALADNTLSSIALFNDLLRRLGAHMTADQLFADWVVANFLNDPKIAGGKYGYTHTQVRSIVSSTQQLPFTAQGTLPQYSANYLDIPHTNGAPFTLNFTGHPTVPLLSTTAAPASGFWWSNRGDGVDNTLSLPPLDLRAQAHATLHYQIYYDLEQDYDYGYVEVSTDGGKTWYAQHTARMTTTNPNGTNMADGYTGASCTSGVTDQRCWINEQINLSRYAGKQILIRFEQVTDDETNG